MRRLEERRARWREQKKHADARRAAYLEWKSRNLPGLVALQERMAAGEAAHDVMREDPDVRSPRR